MPPKDIAWVHQRWGLKRAFYNKFLFAALFIITSFTYVFQLGTGYPILSRLFGSTGFEQPLTEEDFVHQATKMTLDGYNPTPVSEYCTHGSWNTSQAISCGLVFGGIGDTRNMVLSCLRYAMLSGMGFIIPTLSLYSSDDSKVLKSTGEAPFDHSFNQELFISRLHASCPHMTIYNDVQSAMMQKVEIFTFSPLPRQINICDDGAKFASNFGSLLTYPTSIYRLAFSALHTFSIQQNLSIDPSALFSRSSFLGVHLQPSSDGSEDGWGSTSYKEQSKDYLELARRLKFPVIYVSSGNSLSVFRFMVEAAAQSLPIKVVAKENLLSGNNLEELRKLTWEQVELVDHVFLQSAGFFAGIQENSFSWSVAMARTKCWGGEESVCGEGGETLREGRWWKNNWSMIIGDYPPDFRGRIWP